jgi:hypothetical protein
MKVLRFLILAALGGALLLGGYAVYCHSQLTRQRRFAEDFFAKARKWKPLRTTEQEVERDLPDLKKQQVWCGEEGCFWSYELEAKPASWLMPSRIPGIRWSKVFVEVTLKNGLLTGLSTGYRTSYSDGMFRIFDLTSRCSADYRYPNAQTWAIAPVVTTVPINSGRAMQQCYKPTLSHDDWLRVLNWNLDCIDRWRPCKEWSEVMPETWMEFKRQGSEEPIYRFEER